MVSDSWLVPSLIIIITKLPKDCPNNLSFKNYIPVYRLPGALWATVYPYMNTHDHYTDLAALAALDALESEERLDFERHVATCAECRQAVRDYRHVTAALDRSIPQVQAPAALEAKVMRQIHTAQTRAPRRLSPMRWLAVAGVLAFLLLSGFTWRLSQQLNELRAQNERQATQLAELRDSLPGIDAKLIQLASTSTIAGQMVWTPKQNPATVVVQNLPKLDDGRCYVIWLIRKDGTIDNAGAFYNAQLPDGTLRISVRSEVSWSDYAQIALTNEPASAKTADQPSGTVLVSGMFEQK